MSKKSTPLWEKTYRRFRPISKYADDYEWDSTEDGGKELKYCAQPYIWPVNHSKRRLITAGALFLLAVVSVLPGVMPSVVGSMLLVGIFYGLSQAALIYLLYITIRILCLGTSIERIDKDVTVRRANIAASVFASAASCTALLGIAELFLLSTRSGNGNGMFIIFMLLSACGGWAYRRLLAAYSRRIISNAEK